ncbi:hypothetical protein GP486_000332 [Trichoglossum hirsutum]|uniref:Sfi1 spindle body domain-containing protein n=1 Tax=Trichoglossum hirsutum TaxID=265104 RepID=A0A9P8RTN7_9PEZI|nr:hypothetical protein GP486_000332 [Trichoglossum hirsutum]
MPPSSPPFENVEELSPLTDESGYVEVLHLIITTAQSLPQAERFPYRTLFEAYDTVLLQNGLNPGHDQVYFRFLLRLGGIHGDGTLYEKFETLLGQMGIRLEFDEDGGGTQEVTRQSGSSTLEKDESPGQVDIPRGRQRRASFCSVYGAGDEGTQRNGRRTRSHSSMSRPQASLSTMRNGIVSTMATTRTAERILSHDGAETFRERPAQRGRLTSQDFGRNLQHYRKRGRSTPSPGYSQLWRRSRSSDSLAGRPLPAPEFSRSHVAENVIRTSEPSEGDNLRVGDHVPPELLFRPSEAQMALDAEKFYHQHLSGLVMRILRRWRDIAIQLQYHYGDLDIIAADHDMAVLLHQAFDTWRVALQDKKQKAETERFFAHIERRAEKARDLYLVTKAFTHWAQSASDEVERTSVARRHIIRARCFNAWRDITAINELKVRRQMLKKFYRKWKQNYLGAASVELKAVAVYEENMVSKIYWAWFWVRKDKQALDVRSRWVKKRYLGALITNSRRRRERALWIQNVKRQRLLGKLLGEWSLKARALSRLRGEAMDFRDMSLQQNCLHCWRRQAELTPVARQVAFNVEWRISRDAFVLWLQRTRTSSQATTVDRLRILRNTWTNWNDRLRSQAIAIRIDERIVLQALYKWVLIERANLLKRLFEKRLKQAVFRKLVQTLDRQRIRVQQSERAVREMREGNLMASAFRRWHLQTGLNRQRERLAFGFQVPRIVHEKFHIWTSELEHVRHLERWAQDAEFYFLTMKMIKAWQAATTNSRRQKRKVAYAHARRIVKVNLASLVFALWRERSSQVTALRLQTEAIDQNRIAHVGIVQINTWRGQLQKVTNMVLQANSAYNACATKRHFHIWSGNLDRRREMDEKAGYYAQVRNLEVAAALLRRWRMRVLGNHGRDLSAQLFKERNGRMHFRNIFTHWQNRAAQQRGRGPINLGVDRLNDGDLEGNDTKGAEGWTVFDDGFDYGDWIPGLEASSSTPVPGYLNTPSKRAARAKALVRLAATPKVRRSSSERKIFSVTRDFRRSEFGKSIQGERPDLGENKRPSSSQGS